ncbi:MAG: hypothetical protein GX595_07685, partial [Lentisphaerae bacterium]|nr:hypothetical protein [Lentisphaerota bacterium]
MTTMPWLTLFPSRHASAASARVSGDRRRRLWRLALAGLAAALPLQALGPAVSSQAPSGVTGAAALTTLTLSFNQALVPARARQPAAYELLHLGANRAAGGGDDQAVALTPAYVDGALEVTLTSAAPLAEGLYRITVRSDATNGLQNLAAEFLDQNQDGTPDSYVASLEVDLTPPAVSGVAAGTCLVYDDGYDMVTLPHEALNG